MENPEEKIKEILALALEIDASKIDENSSQESISEWDSLNHLKLISELEKAFNLKLTLREITDAITFSNIANIIKNK